ncbi:DNA adenine methylase [Sphingomonadales bacterium 56]|uniref:DNA adenine methylase n=1 Tax=unclassified Sphingobium TaxID=2611147 RepID=UPI001919AC0C|nr:MULTISPECIES: DNA adenine methylase [unclassified Sphingobium]MBY2927829.1 DNA adenine methylase [Sphingomonadales bacterium 56]MBY2957929.1 DNA adenine methylase [Sphingomonadales bacterium 58]CAD7336018.1 Modification methylase DpnIIA [Sphingobium sp. S6]CAD7336081.1 Modification methylase DpnIIA [Sphingobium sp. S8]
MMSLDKVSPVSPAAGYLGGKRNLARRICAIIEATEHDGYGEPFVGMGGIFFRRAARPRFEAINDISGDVTTLFRVVRRHYQAFVDEMEWLLAGREEFERLRAVDPATLTDIERAARFLYLQRLAFGGKIVGRNFGVSTSTSARFNLAQLRATLMAIRDRLQPVVIERLPYGDFLRRYDRPGMLFYLDPPYWDCEEDYGRGVFCREDFDRLAAQLQGLAGKFILSINDTPGVRECFAGFAMSEVETTYSVATAARGRGKKAGELIISNVPLA